MSAHDARLLLNGQSSTRPSYEATYWDRLAEPSILVPFLVLLATIAYTTNLIDHARDLLPPAFARRTWNLLVTATPSSLLFAIDDWLNPFPIPRPPADRASTTALHEAKSSALGRLLGHDKAGGIIASVSYAGKSGLSRLMPKGDSDRPAGLGNMSNSCYQNSVLQALCALAPLREYLAWIAEEEAAGSLPPVQAANTLAHLVHDLHGLAVNGETLWTPPVLKRMSTYQQQDAQEYFSNLLNEVEEEVEKALKEMHRQPGLDTDLSLSLRERTAIHDSEDQSAPPASPLAAAAAAACYRIPLEGLMAQRIVCRSCGYSSGLSTTPFYCLTLSLDHGSAEYRLEETLDSFSAVENIEGVQCASCTLLKFRDRIRILIGHFETESGLNPEETRRKQPIPYERLEAIQTALDEDDFEEKTLSEKCKIPDQQRVSSTKARQVGIARAPPSIAFHINRSRYDESTGYTYKNPAAVRFPLRLDLGPWYLGSAASLLADQRDQETQSTFENSPPSSSSVPSLTSDSLSVTEREEQWQLPPQLPMVSGTRYHSQLAGPLYELRAVITHYGQHENGHYVCYRKHTARPNQSQKFEDADEEKRPDDEDDDNRDKGDDEKQGEKGEEKQDSMGQDESSDSPEKKILGFDRLENPHGPNMTKSQWWRLSDQNVSLSDESMVLSQGGVFMLFYDRIDERSAFTSAVDEDAAPGSVDSTEADPETDMSSPVSAEENCGSTSDEFTDVLEVSCAKVQITALDGSDDE